MAELAEADIIAKIAALDASIATITDAITGAGTTGAAYVDYTLGVKSVSASQKLKQLMEARTMYQGLLTTLPKEIVRSAHYDVGVDGEDKTELIGDE